MCRGLFGRNDLVDRVERADRTVHLVAEGAADRAPAEGLEIAVGRPRDGAELALEQSPFLDVARQSVQLVGFDDGGSEAEAARIAQALRSNPRR